MKRVKPTNRARLAGMVFGVIVGLLAPLMISGHYIMERHKDAPVGRLAVYGALLKEFYNQVICN